MLLGVLKELRETQVPPRTDDSGTDGVLVALPWSAGSCSLERPLPTAQEGLKVEGQGLRVPGQKGKKPPPTHPMHLVFLWASALGGKRNFSPGQ